MDINSLPPYVVFETRAVEDRSIELSQGVYGFRDIHIAKITRPGQRDTVERVAEEWLADLNKKAKENLIPANWPMHFQVMFDAWKRGVEIPTHGTPILGWSLMTPSEQKNVIAQGFRTLEDLANASDEAIQRIGMGGNAYKQKAKNWLEEGTTKGAMVARVTSLEIENKQLKDTLENLLAEVKELKKEKA